MINMMIYLVPQHRHNECATACIQMLLEHYGRDLSYDGVSFFIPKDASLDDIQYVLSLLDIKSICYKSLTKNINNMFSYPFIMHVKSLFYYHYVVVSEIKDNKVLVYDPGKSHPKWMKINTIKRKWTGYYIETFGREVNNKKKRCLKYPLRVFIKLFILYISFILFYFSISVL